jgi:putative transposase
MSRRGNGWDNAPAESFFHTLKVELTHYCQRRHSSLGYQTPAHYEAPYQKAA